VWGGRGRHASLLLVLSAEVGVVLLESAVILVAVVERLIPFLSRC